MIRQLVAALLLSLAADAYAANAPRLRPLSTGGGRACAEIWPDCPLETSALPNEPPFIAPRKPEQCGQAEYERFAAGLHSSKLSFNAGLALARSTTCQFMFNSREASDDYVDEHRRHLAQQTAIFRKAMTARWEAFLASCTGAPSGSP